MSLRSGKLPFLGSEDEFLDHTGFVTAASGVCFFSPWPRLPVRMVAHPPAHGAVVARFAFPSPGSRQCGLCALGHENQHFRRQHHSSRSPSDRDFYWAILCGSPSHVFGRHRHVSSNTVGSRLICFLACLWSGDPFLYFSSSSSKLAPLC